MISPLPSLSQSIPHPHSCNSTPSFLSLFGARETKEKGIPKGTILI